MRPGTTNPPDGYSIKANVRRVVVDVVVTDSQGNPKRGLTEKDFSVKEDGTPQRILSFDPHADDAWTGLLPANVPPNTFINLPKQAEQGPLYVLFYDMVNTGDDALIGADYSANIIARQQLIKFINSKSAGTRFALIVLSDGLHLVQGFTNDKQLLLTALDPEGHTPHMPKVFLYSANYGIRRPQLLPRNHERHRPLPRRISRPQKHHLGLRQVSLRCVCQSGIFRSRSRCRRKGRKAGTRRNGRPPDRHLPSRREAAFTT